MPSWRMCQNGLHQQQSASTYFEWLFLQPLENPPQKLIPAVIRIKAR